MLNHVGNCRLSSDADDEAVNDGCNNGCNDGCNDGCDDGCNGPNHLEINNVNLRAMTNNNAFSANDAILQELSEFGSNLNSVERFVQKLSLLDSGTNDRLHREDRMLREAVKIRPLQIDHDSCQEIERSVDTGVYYRRFSTEADLQPVIDLITKDLSEPYSIYTYRYFIYNWPRLCIIAFSLDGRCIGAVVGKTEAHASTGRVRGYIAMLAVQHEFRRRQIGSRLVELVIDTMIADHCSEVVLETEITNKSALSLYQKLGFVRDKRLFRYYLNGVDAFRLKLWMS